VGGIMRIVIVADAARVSLILGKYVTSVVVIEVLHRPNYAVYGYH
jgi:hypothetical protein